MILRQAPERYDPRDQNDLRHALQIHMDDFRARGSSPWTRCPSNELPYSASTSSGNGLGAGPAPGSAASTGGVGGVKPSGGSISMS